MNIFSNNINLRKTDYLVGESEYNILNDFCKPIIKIDLNRDNLFKAWQDIHSTGFVFFQNDLMLIIKFSIHQDCFKYEKAISNFLKKNKKPKFILNFIKQKKIGVNSYISLYTAPPIYFSNQVFGSEITSLSSYIYNSIHLGSISLKNLNIKLQTQKEFIDLFFDFPNFIKFIPKHRLDFLKNENLVDLNLIDEFCKISRKIFFDDVESKVKTREDFCFGLISNNDLGFIKSSCIPLLINVKSPYRGNNLIDFLFLTSINELNYRLIPNEIIKSNNKTESEIELLCENSWILNQVYAFMNELLFNSYPNLWASRRLQNSNVYFNNRARFESNSDLSRFIEFFDIFFVDKYK